MGRKRTIPCSLPSELLREILARLPVKSLLRFRCVLKGWCMIIDGDDFTLLHLTRYMKNRKNDAVHAISDAAFLVMEMGADDRRGKWMIRRGDTFRKTLELDPEFDGYNISGYVNGVLFFWHEYRLIMWNPSVRRRVKVPDYCNFSLNGLVFGFGFDALSNDYKVVKIGNPPGQDVSHASSVLAVFSFRSGCWREVDVAVRIRCHDQSIFFKGTIYWLFGKTASFYIGKGREFISFDVHSDALGYVDVPKHDEKELLRSKLAIVHDSLALLDISRERSTIWLMDKDWETIQWTKRYSVEIDGFFVFELYFLKTNAEILFGREDGVKSYRFESRDTRGLSKTYPRFVSYMANYVKSLVLLKGLGGQSANPSGRRVTKSTKTRACVTGL